MDKSLPDGSVKRSTKLPDGGHQPTKTTTEHVHVVCKLDLVFFQLYPIPQMQ